MASRFGLLKKARRYYRKQDYPKAVNILDSEFFANDAIAHFILGQIYTYGNKRETNLASDVRKAMKHFKLSSEMGYAEASYEVANNYELGSGVKTSYNMAKKYYQKAIEQGHIVSKYYLADLYIEHFPKNIVDAICLLEEVIAQKEYEGHACLKLGRIYLRGKTGETDYVKARQWFEKGQEYQSKNCCMDLAYIYFYGLGVSKDLHKALELVEIAGADHILYDEIKETIEKEIAIPGTIH